MRHSFRCVGDGEGTIRVEVRPAGELRAMLEDRAEVARGAQLTRRGLPGGPRAALRVAKIPERHRSTTVVCRPLGARRPLPRSRAWPSTHDAGHAAGDHLTTRLHPIRTGTVSLSPGYVFRPEAANVLEALGRGVPRGARLTCPIGAFLIEHPTRGPVLIDTGLHPIVATEPSRNLGALGAAVMGNLRIGPEENVPAQLRARGLAPDDVRLVVMTHLHADHTSAMSAFANATFVTTRPEWRAARGRLGWTNGYLRRHLPPEGRVRFVDLSDGRPWDGLDRTVDLLGDGSIRLVSTPGHTVDHLSVLVATEHGPVFLLGDAVYTLRNLTEDILPWRTASDEASLTSMRQLRAYAREHPGVPLVPTHDGEAWRELVARC